MANNSLTRGPEPPPMTGGEILVRSLQALGIELVFGVPGGQTLAIIEALERIAPPRFVTAHHESAAASMADAYGRLKRRPGVCLGTTGPGATNLLTGVGGGFRDSSPMLVLTCNNFTPDLERDDTQAADHSRIFGPLTKRTWLVTDPTVINQVVNEAYLVACSGCPGPVLIDFSRTALEAKVASPRLADPSALLKSVHQRPSGDDDLVQRAAELVFSAERPVLWVGNGVHLSDAGASALSLIERLRMPAMTTFNSIGALPAGNPLVFGPRSRMGTSLTAEILAEADLVLAVGNSLNAVSTARWSTAMPKTIIQVDIEPTMLGRYYPDRTVGIVGDAKSVLCQLLDISDRSSKNALRTRNEWIADLQDRKRSFQQRVREWPKNHPSPPGTIHPIDVITALREESDDEAMLVVDAGNAGVWSHFWEVRATNRYVKPVGFGNMGFGVPAAIAAGLVLPTTQVFVLVGDGSMGMTMIEVETFVREKLDVCVIVLNDGGYGNIRQEQIFFYGKTGIGVDFGAIDYAAIARACGLEGVTVTTTDALRDALRSFGTDPKPTLIDAHIDPAPNVWTFPLLASKPTNQS